MSGTLAVSLHRFESGEEALFEDRCAWPAYVEDEALSCLETDDGGYAWVVGTPSATSRRGPSGGYVTVTAYFGVEIDTLSAGVVEAVWEIARDDRLAIAHWGDPEKLADSFDDSEHVSRLRLDPPPIAVATTDRAVATALPARWPDAVITATADELYAFLT